MEYDSVNRLTRYNGETVRYDADGNMIYGPLNGVMTKFTYDCRNRLIQAGNTTYIYDAENNRIGMETPKKWVRYVVDSQQELTRILQANETNIKTNEQNVTYYIYGRGLIAQEQITVEDGFNSTVEEKSGFFGRTKYKTGIYRIYHFDHLGSTTAVTNEEGTVVNSYDYSPYGQIIAGKEDVYLFLYNGQYGVTTDGNGLYHMRARYYNVSIMRFINQDVVHGNLSDSQSLNRFAYVEGNPINFLDPFGLNKTDNSEVYENLHLLIRGIQLTVMLIGLCTELGMVPSLIIAAILGAIDWILYFIEYGEDGVYTPDEQKELVFYGLIFVLGLIATYYTVDILLVCFPDFIDWLKNVITEEMEENEKERAIPYDKDTDSEYIIIPNEL